LGYSAELEILEVEWLVGASGADRLADWLAGVGSRPSSLSNLAQLRGGWELANEATPPLLEEA